MVSILESEGTLGYLLRTTMYCQSVLHYRAHVFPVVYPYHHQVFSGVYRIFSVEDCKKRVFPLEGHKRRARRRQMSSGV